MTLTFIFITAVFLIFLIFLGGVSINYRDKYNELVKNIQENEEAKNSNRTRIPITWNGKCVKIYADATPEEFTAKFGAPWRTQTHRFITGVKNLSLTYTCSEMGTPSFMTAWFDENYRLDTINTD